MSERRENSDRGECETERKGPAHTNTQDGKKKVKYCTCSQSHTRREWGGGREREGETDRQTDRDRDRQKLPVMSSRQLGKKGNSVRGLVTGDYGRAVREGGL